MSARRKDREKRIILASRVHVSHSEALRQIRGFKTQFGLFGHFLAFVTPEYRGQRQG